MATSNDPLIETRFFTVGEIARIARVSKMTVYREVHAGRLDSVRIGRSFRIPEESVRLFQLAQAGPSEELDSLYAWFLPLLRLDTVPKFVQLIKLVQQECGGPIARVRPPRLELTAAEREEVTALTRRSLDAVSKSA